VSLDGPEALIPIFFATVGLFAVGWWLVRGLSALVEWFLDRRAVKAQTGAPAMVARMDGLETRMDKLETGVVRIIELLEQHGLPAAPPPQNERERILEKGSA
jgi:hypothetical protein